MTSGAPSREANRELLRYCLWALALLLTARFPLRGALAAPDEAAAQAASPRSLPAVTSVAAVDLNRYLGGWYEIARIPNRFQQQCVRHSVAVYSPRPDGGLSVLNQCIKANGNVDQVTGVARVVDPVSRARLRVSLVSFLGWRPFWGDYWVIGLDPDYRWAVVGTPDRRYGWVLARSERLDASSLLKIRMIVEGNGYTWKRFNLTSIQQPGGPGAN